MPRVAEAERRIRGSSKGGEVLLAGLGLTSLTPLLPAFKDTRGIRSLDVSGNALTELPADLGAALPSAVRLNAAGNPFPGARAVLMGLRGMPALKDLWIDLPLETEEDQLIVALPSLELFNGTSLTEDEPVEEELEEATPPHPAAGRDAAKGRGSSSSSARASYWTSDDSRAAEELFAQITEASAGATHPQEFFDYLSRVVKHVTCLTAADDDPLCQEGEVLKARRLLFEYCAEEAAKAVARKDPTLGRGMAALVQFNSALMDDYDTHWRRIFRDRDARLTLMKRDMKDAIKQIESLMMQVDAAGGVEGPGVPRADEAPASESRSGRAGPRHADPVPQPAREQRQQARPFDSSDSEVGEAEESGGARGFGRHRVRDEPREAFSAERQVPASSPTAALVDSRGTPSRSSRPTRDATDARGSSGRSPPGHESHADPSPGPRRAARRSRTGTEVGGHGVSYNGKVLTLKQLKDTIEDIYASKTKYDTKCRENGLPRETMEQHMYTYLNQRYGLKEIIQDWATAIARGIKRYAADDNDVAVFGKILRNDIDEEFRYVQRQVRDTVRELVRAQIKGRRPLQSEQDINSQLERKMAGSLTEEEWSDVVRYMYNKQDAATLVALIRKTIYQQTLPSRVRRQGRGAASAAEASMIPYKDLVRLLLDFQLEGHERFLADFVAIVRRYDRDGNGIVNSEEFKAIVRAVDSEKSEDEVEAMAKLIDPFGTQLITFSETVTFLTDELAKMARAR